VFECQEQHPGSGVIVVVVIVVVVASSEIHVPWHCPSHLTCDAEHQVDVPQPALFQEQHPADGGVGDGDGVGAGVGEGVGAGVGEGVGAGVGEGVGAGVGEGVGVGVGVPSPIQPVEPTPQSE